MLADCGEKAEKQLTHIFLFESRGSRGSRGIKTETEERGEMDDCDEYIGLYDV